MGKRLPEVPKSFMFDGWSVSLEGSHMKDEAAFVKETKRFWNGNEATAKEAWKTGQLILNPPKETPVKPMGGDVTNPIDTKI